MPNAQPEAVLAPAPLYIFDTHPIQYRSPVFREFAKKSALKVFFFDEQFDGSRWWFHEVGKIPPQPFAMDLKTGFESEVLKASEGLSKFSKRVRSVLAKGKPGAVLIYGYYLPEHWIVRHWCKKLRIPLLFIGETFSDGGTLPRRILKSLLQPRFFSAVSGCVSIGEKSDAFYRRFLKRSAITPAKYCIDTSFFRMSPEQGRAARTKIRELLRIPEDAFVMLFVGRLFERKRPFDALQLHERFTHEAKFYTVVVGNGPLEEELKTAAKNSVCFFPVGFRNQPSIRDYYHAADLLFVPSEYETWGLVINEAMATGTPALVTDTCGAAGDLVIPGETGGVFPVTDIDEAAKFVWKCLRNPDEYRQMREKAQKKVCSEFDVSQFAEAIQTAFVAAAGKRN